MHKPFTVFVTAEDIRDGVKTECRACPIARAVSRQLPGTEISVGLCFVTAAYPIPENHNVFFDIVGAELYFRAELPPEACQFMTLFDAGHPVEPLSFTLTPR